jgi:23S rRNA (cytosine1962-C5)-methyltransferase
MPPVATLKLKRPLERAISGGHPWVYADALEGTRGLPVGAEVELLTRNGRPLARGLYDPSSPIALRIYTLDRKEAIDAAFVERRLGRALSLRRFGDDTNAYRWCNGEGDLLPGVVLDRYDHVVVARFDGAAARTLAPLVIGAVQKLAPAIGVDRLYERADRRMGGGVGEVLWGATPPARVPIREHGVAFSVDVLRGQKTGFFLDQRENRRRLRGWARGLRVANLFSYSGGFSVNAALGGATTVTSVDLAKAAVDAAREHFAQNGLDPAAHGFVAADAFDWLKAQPRAAWDLIVTDPPSFAPSEKALDAALAAYRDLNAAAAGLLVAGGTLCAASCSSHVSMDAFLGSLGEASRQARRPFTVLEAHGQPQDHPSPAGFPEGRYLKFVRLRVD